VISWISGGCGLAIFRDVEIDEGFGVVLGDVDFGFPSDGACHELG